MKKWTPKQIKILKEYWRMYKAINDKYWNAVTILDDNLSKEIGIECEIFHCEHEACGIGSLNRKMELVQRNKLEE